MNKESPAHLSLLLTVSLFFVWISAHLSDSLNYGETRAGIFLSAKEISNKTNAKKKRLIISPPYLSVTSDAGTELLTVKSNVKWRVRSGASWLDAKKTSGRVKINFEKNTGPERQATVTVSGEGLSDQTVIIQKGATPTPTPSPTPSLTPSITPTPTLSPTPTQTPPYTPTPTPSYTPPVTTIQPIETKLIQSNVHGTATFQSFNQKMIKNNYGIFMTYRPELLNESSQSAISSTWKLLRSIDNGETFSVVYEETNNYGNNAPALETDSNGNLFVLLSYYFTKNSEIWTFSPADNFSSHRVFTVPGSGIGGKFTLLYDYANGNRFLYFFSHSGGFYKMKTDIQGNIQLVAGYQLTVAGPSAQPQYPLLALDENGILYAAWTNWNTTMSKYWSIHAIRSLDKGNSWQTLNGAPLGLPVVCDETGPATRITSNNEFDVNTWLWNFLPRDNKIHFAYEIMAPPYDQIYVRYNLGTGQEDKRIQPEWKGNRVSLASLDGFVVRDNGNPFRSYWVSRTADNHIGVLYTEDSGLTWHDYGKSDYSVAPGRSIYATGGFREVTSDSFIIGAFTDYNNGRGDVYFLKLRAR